MESLRDALRQSANTPSQQAAAALACFQETVGVLLLPNEAKGIRAVSLQRGRLTARVGHGALAGILQQRSSEVIRETNNLITKKFGPKHLRIEKIVTRAT